jgi:hypothetical protein
MPPLKGTQKKNVVKETRSAEEIAIQSAIHSQYFCMYPMADAAYARLKNPIDGNDYHFSTQDSNFYAMLYDLSQKGMTEKILKDLTYFAENYDVKWNNVKDTLIGYIKSKETENASS